jgi:hypothetical protein
MQVKCGSCGRMDHRTSECKFLGYHPNKFLIIGRYIYRRKQRLKNFKRKDKKPFNTLKGLSIVSNTLNDFMADMVEDEDFRDIVSINNIIDMDSSVSMDIQSNAFGKHRKASEDPKEEEESTKSALKVQKNMVRIHSALDFPQTEKANHDPQKSIIRIHSALDFQQYEKASHEPQKVAINIPVIDTKTTKNPTKFETLWDFFFQFDKLKNYKFFSPKNNADHVLIRMHSKNFPISKSCKFIYEE